MGSGRAAKLMMLAAGALLGGAVLAGAVALGAGLLGSTASNSGHPDRGGVASKRCTAHAADFAAAEHDVQQAPGGGVVCLAAGHYGGMLSLAAAPAGYVTVRPAPGAHVVVGGLDLTGSHIAVRGLWIDGEVKLEAGDSFILLAHNDISNLHSGGEGVVFDTSDCTAPNAPTWPGCEPLAAITDVTISANHFHDIGQGSSEDAIHLDNWRSVTVAGNEFDHIIESGSHTDCLQSVYGGTGLTFTHNYEHDNDCQGFFVKDGDASDVSFTDNLFIRDNASDAQGVGYANFAQIWNVHGLTVRHNTIWDGKGLALVAAGSTVSPTAMIDHNLISNLVVEPPVGTPYALAESHDIFGQAPSTLGLRDGDRIVARPRFVDPARDDYRLRHDRAGIGVDWSPAGRHYGPAS